MKKLFGKINGFDRSDNTLTVSIEGDINGIVVGDSVSLVISDKSVKIEVEQISAPFITTNKNRKLEY